MPLPRRQGDGVGAERAELGRLGIEQGIELAFQHPDSLAHLDHRDRPLVAVPDDLDPRAVVAFEVDDVEAAAPSQSCRKHTKSELPQACRSSEPATAVA